MRNAITILAACLLASPVPVLARPQTEASAPVLTGDWKGALSPAPGQSIPLILHVGGEPGHWTASLDSPAQGAFGLTASAVAIDGNTAHFEWTALKAHFAATLSGDGQALTGTWSQGGGALPLTFHRAATGAPPAASRPQTPRPPFPYRAEDVAYDNPPGEAHLAGTLTLPEGDGPFPAVLLITGSGLQDRDETIMGHKPFLVWADYLTRRGIAVLRVDDRQVGGSTGDVSTATTADFAGDVEAGIAFLKSRPDIDPRRIGLMGHSEGGVIAPMVAARDPAVSFVVMLAGSGEPGEDLLLQQKRLIETAAGLPPAAVDQSLSTARQLFDAVKDAPGQSEADAALESAWQAVAKEAGHGGEPMPQPVKVIASPWMRWFLRYDPRPVLAKIDCPVLAVNGTKDLQVPPGPNLDGIRQALRHNPDATVVALPGLNHLLQTAATGQVSEYSEIAETIAPLALQTVGDWIVAHTRRGP